MAKAIGDIYKTYVRNYNIKAASKVGQYVGMREILSLENFSNAYYAFKESREVEIKEGTRKVPNILQDMVNKQVNYTMSEGKAKAVRNALMLEKKEKVRLIDIRKNSDKFWADLKLERFNYMQLGYDSAQANRYISRTFFGSK